MPDLKTMLLPAARVGAAMPTQVETGGGPVLVVRGPGGFVATPVTCPHKDESLRFSVLMGDVLVCPHHGYEFSLLDGRCRNVRRCAALSVVPLEEVDGELWINNDALRGITGAG